MGDIVLVAKTLFDGVWRMLVETKFPGTDFSLAALSIAVLIAVFAIAILKLITGFSMGGSTYGRASDAVEKAKLAYDSKHKRKIGF